MTIHAENIADDALAEPKSLSICTISDGVDAVIRLAGWIAQLPAGLRRTDLELAEALSHLTSTMAGSYDRIVLAPNAEREDASPRIIQAILDATVDRCSRQIILWPLGMRLSIRGTTKSQILYGPPFPAFNGLGLSVEPGLLDDIPAQDATGPKIRRFFSWLQKAPPAPPPATARRQPIRLISLQPMAGGAGASSLAANIASELAEIAPALEICLIDLDLQFGSIGSYLDLQSDARIVDAYRDISKLDRDAFQQCLVRVRNGLRVLPAPAEILPFDALDSSDLHHLIVLARQTADLVILDLPSAIPDWCETAYLESDKVLGICSLDVRSAANIRKLRDLIGPQNLGPQKLAFVLNRSPLRPPKDWSTRLSEFEKGLGQPIETTFLSGGEGLGRALDSGASLGVIDPASPLLKQIRDYCLTLKETIDSRKSSAVEPS